MAADDAMGKPPPFPQPEPGAKLTHRLPGGRWLDVLCTALAGTDERVIDFRDVTAARASESRTVTTSASSSVSSRARRATAAGSAASA